MYQEIQTSFNIIATIALLPIKKSAKLIKNIHKNILKNIVLTVGLARVTVQPMD